MSGMAVAISSGWAWPGHLRLAVLIAAKSWMGGTRAGMTQWGRSRRLLTILTLMRHKHALGRAIGPARGVCHSEEATGAAVLTPVGLAIACAQPLWGRDSWRKKADRRPPLHRARLSLAVYSGAIPPSTAQ